MFCNEKCLKKEISVLENKRLKALKNSINPHNMQINSGSLGKLVKIEKTDSRS
jgi:hypothetical protein